MASSTQGITYGQLHQLLRKLHFEGVPAPEREKAFRHTASGTLVLLADHPPDQPARIPAVVSIRRHLAENGILEEADFDRFVANVR